MASRRKNTSRHEREADHNATRRMRTKDNSRGSARNQPTLKGYSTMFLRSSERFTYMSVDAISIQLTCSQQRHNARGRVRLEWLARSEADRDENSSAAPEAEYRTLAIPHNTPRSTMAAQQHSTSAHPAVDRVCGDADAVLVGQVVQVRHVPPRRHERAGHQQRAHRHAQAEPVRAHLRGRGAQLTDQAFAASALQAAKGRREQANMKQGRAPRRAPLGYRARTAAAGCKHNGTHLPVRSSNAILVLTRTRR